MGDSNQDDGVYNNNNNNNDDQYYLSDIHRTSTITGPFGIDPLDYTEFCILCLFCWAFYLFIPRGFRFTYCGSYPKRYAWSSRSKRRRNRRMMQPCLGNGTYNGMNNGGVNHSSYNDYADSTAGTGSVVSITESSTTMNMNTNHRELSAQGMRIDPNNNNNNNHKNINHGGIGMKNRFHHQSQSLPEEEEVIDFTSPQPTTSIHRNVSYSMGNNNNNYHNRTMNHTPGNNMIQQNTPFSSSASTFNDEIAISTTMQQLRDTGIKIIAHGSKGKPKSVRLILTENAIEWRTESTSSRRRNKAGKTHQVPLSHIMYVDVGKQTTALRRVENASIADHVCLSLLTRDGSLDLEASSSQERDALVNCFSLVLDEVHAKNWRDVYRAPSSDLPSSFDEFDMTSMGVGGGGGGGGAQQMEI